MQYDCEGSIVWTVKSEADLNRVFALSFALSRMGLETEGHAEVRQVELTGSK